MRILLTPAAIADVKRIVPLNFTKLIPVMQGDGRFEILNRQSSMIDAEMPIC